jgi:hypothetical protein
MGDCEKGDCRTDPGCILPERSGLKRENNDYNEYIHWNMYNS